jgi:hypothetical protein
MFGEAIAGEALNGDVGFAPYAIGRPTKPSSCGAPCSASSRAFLWATTGMISTYTHGNWWP